MAENLVNKKFGRLTVLEEVGKDKYYNRIYLCQCECGNKVKVKRTQLVSGKTKSCGCLRKEVASKRKSQNLVGKKFNQLTVLEEIGKDKQGIKWLCQCECGNTTVVHTKHLKSGNIKSCGCLSYKHHQYGTRLYQTWTDMKRRCYIPSNKSYKYYGKLGVTVCPEWKEDFESFYKWAIENGYKDYLTIDRINPYGNYEPSNCRWATMKEQSTNKRKKNTK